MKLIFSSLVLNFGGTSTTKDGSGAGAGFTSGCGFVLQPNERSAKDKTRLQNRSLLKRFMKQWRGLPGLGLGEEFGFSMVICTDNLPATT